MREREGHTDRLMREFLERARDGPPDIHPRDRLALQFTTGWHRHPLFRESLEYAGINLGEMLEYALWQEVVRVLHEQDSETDA